MNSDGTKFIVGANLEDPTGANLQRGAAYVFTYSSGSWDTGARLVAWDPEDGDQFGHSVAMSSDGTKVIVGAHREDTGGSDNGAVYIFTYDSSSSSWGTGSKLQAIPSYNTGSADNQFGYSVAMNSNGTKIIVGARYEDSDAGASVNTNAGNSGAAFIYTYDGSNWGSGVRIKASDAESSDYFGTSVAMNSDGTTVIVGAPDEDTTYATAGAAYIYTYNGSTWPQQQKIQCANNVNGDKKFGQSVDVSGDGNKFIVGAYWEDTSGGDAGSAYIYTYDGSTWGNLGSSEAQLANPSLTSPSSDHFGWSVAMSSDGTKVIMGARYAEPSSAGAAYIYTYSNSSWGTGVDITASDKFTGDYFGSSVAMNSDGSRVIIAAENEDGDGGTDRGAAYFYQFDKITDSGFVFDASTQVFTATGTGIIPGSTVQLEGADGTLYSVFNTTPPNAAGSQVTFKMGSGEVSEFPPSAMSTNTSITGYTASGSGNYNSSAWRAFDDVVSVNEYWPAGNGTLAGGYSTSSPYLAQSSTATTSGHVGHWLQLQIPSAVILTRAVIGTTSSGFQHGQFVILGSNDGTNWTLLHAGTGTTLSTDVTTLSAGLREAFSYFRVVIKSKTSSTQNYNIELNNVQFFGPPSGSWVVSNQPYKVKVNSTSGLTGTSTAAIGFAVGWTTAANLNFVISKTTTHTLVGTDGGGGTNRTFSISPLSAVQALPSGLQPVTAGGVITGQIAADQLNIITPVTFRLTDNGSGLFTDRVIKIVGTTALYPFTSPFTFTNAGATGRTGPTLTELTTGLNGYTPTWTDNTNYLNVTAGIQEWTVPKTGSYTIEVFGAEGGQYTSAANTTAAGARMKGTFSLTESAVLKILVGQQGGSDTSKAGGGGGTFVATSANVPMIVAGGGGGAGLSNNPRAGKSAPTSLTGTTGSGTSAQSGASGYASTSTNNSGYGQTGGGFYTSSVTDLLYGISTNAQGFIQGGEGSQSIYGDTGGFGGGGGGGSNGGGGGGGWSGGGNGGGSGGSYNNGTSQSNSAGANTGHGYVIITQL
jgi:hypothetical protein